VSNGSDRDRGKGGNDLKREEQRIFCLDKSPSPIVLSGKADACLLSWFDTVIQ
jgi:hypothetical protein